MKLIAEKAHIAKLEAAGLFTSKQFAAIDIAQEMREDSIAAAHDCFVSYCSPSYIVDPGHPSELRDQIFAKLRGELLVHVAVVRNPPGQQSQDRENFADVMLRGGLDLDQLCSWYERFLDLARKHLQHMNDVRHVLVLILANKIPNDQTQQLQDLLKRTVDERSLFIRCYVMNETLEFGEEFALHARFVWPVYVSRLLLRLLLYPPKGSGETYAWRGFALLSAPRELQQAALRYEQELLSESMSDSESEQTAPLPELPAALVDQPVKPEWPLSHDLSALAEGLTSGETEWQVPEHFAPQGLVTSSTSITEPWDHAAETVRSARYESSRGAHYRWSMVHDIWRSIAAPKSNNQGATLIAPSELDYQRKRLRKLEEPVDVAGKMKAVAEKRHAVAKGIAQLNQEREVLAQKAKHLNQAQLGYVAVRPRLMICMCVIFAMSLVSLSVFSIAFRSWWDYLIIAGAAMGGALLAVLLPWFLERRRGKLAARQLITEIVEWQDSASDTYSRAVEMLSYAVSAEQVRRDACIIRHLQWSIQRSHQTVSEFLKVQNADGRGGSTGLPPEGQTLEVMRRFERERLRLKSEICPSMDDSDEQHAATFMADHELEAWRPQLQALHQEWCDNFNQAWHRFSGEWDTWHEGGLPYDAMSDFLSRQVGELKHRILLKLNDLAIAQLEQGDGRSKWSDLCPNHSYQFMLSTRALSPTGAQKSEGYILMRGPDDQTSKIIADAWTSQNAGGAIGSYVKVEDERLMQFPLLALVVEEAPIEIQKGVHGFVVGHSEEQGHG